MATLLEDMKTSINRTRIPLQLSLGGRKEDGDGVKGYLAGDEQFEMF